MPPQQHGWTKKLSYRVKSGREREIWNDTAAES